MAICNVFLKSKISAIVLFIIGEYLTEELKNSDVVPVNKMKSYIKVTTYLLSYFAFEFLQNLL